MNKPYRQATFANSSSFVHYAIQLAEEHRDRYRDLQEVTPRIVSLCLAQKFLYGQLVVQLALLLCRSDWPLRVVSSTLYAVAILLFGKMANSLRKQTLETACRRHNELTAADVEWPGMDPNTPVLLARYQQQTKPPISASVTAVLLGALAASATTELPTLILVITCGAALIAKTGSHGAA